MASFQNLCWVAVPAGYAVRWKPGSRSALMNHVSSVFHFLHIVPELAGQTTCCGRLLYKVSIDEKKPRPCHDVLAHHLSALAERSDQYRYQNGMCHLNVQSSHGLKHSALYFLEAGFRHCGWCCKACTG
ncbi:hypothetical protein KCP70_14840 [Salmonella enterica subsp. enterica]|nr:hypothetical protein KCP70_14840 [Salmonella enterica subsp. enterica]